MEIIENTEKNLKIKMQKKDFKLNSLVPNIILKSSIFVLKKTMFCNKVN